ncbi:WG repeat-containing protein [Acinetobacter haemolyticus]|uniref:WG repeat-containing protein n=1 Tax=Acinetobacter haemolyticus TaxID=29430 RepID=UPI001D186516|nr:WG repeat-containing protein [Acinetobacter haemolyticus]
MKQSPQKISMLFISALFSMDVLSNEPIYPIEKKNLLGFVNYTGDIVVKPQFDTGVVHFIGTGRDDLININKDGKRGILSTKGELVIPTIYDNDFNSFNFNKGNIASYTLNGKCGYINDKK